MKKLIFSLCLCAAASWAAAATFYADQFDDQKEIFIYSGASSARCQAVRIAPRWYLTAAHCVYDFCQGKACEIQINLVQDASYSVHTRVVHTPSEPAVYIYEGYSPKTNRSAGTDVALIYYNPSRADTMYMDVLNGRPLTKGAFEEKVSYSSNANEQWKALAKKPSVKLLSFAGAPSAKLKRGIVVPNIGGGGVDYLTNDSREIYFVSPLKLLFSADFGVRPGNSGGGVWTDDLMLAGVVSQYLGSGPMNFYDENGEKVGALSNVSNYFLFTGFTSDTLGFIKTHVPNVPVALGMGGHAKSVTQSFEEITGMIDSARQAM